MNDKQKRFCDEYLIDLNATRAAIRAGYSERTATAQGSRLLTNVKVQNYLQTRLAELKSESIVDIEEIMGLLSRIAREEETQECRDMYGRPYRRRPTIKERLQAAELAGKRLGMFVDRLAIANDEDKPFEVTIEVVKK